MKRTIVTSLTLAIVLVSQLAHAAILVDASGGVTAKLPGGKVESAKVGLELPDGSVVDVAEGGKASIMYESGAMDQLNSAGSYTVGKSQQNAKRDNVGGGIAVAMKELMGSGSDPSVHGMIKRVPGSGNGPVQLTGLGAFGVQAIYPVSTTIIVTPTVTFTWQPKPAIDWADPAFVIDDAKKKHAFISPIGAKDTQFKLTGAASKLQKGAKYTWYLATGAKSPKEKTIKFEFDTLSAEKQAQLTSDIKKIDSMGLSADGKNLLAAQLYYRLHLDREMVDALVPVWENNKTPFVKKMLYIGYWRLGSEEAKKFE